MAKYFVISDVHSFYNEMIEALDNKGFDMNNPEHIVILLGDLFDRGKQANECFEFAKKLYEQNRFVYIRGNHEDLLMACIKEIPTGTIPTFHVTNGTADTIVQFAEAKKIDLLMQGREILNKIQDKIDFIQQATVDYLEIGDYIFVHGWIPCHYQDKILKKEYQFKEDWRNDDWSAARWLNGMEAWQKGIVIPSKTIFCGHWNTSWGHSHIRQDCKEWLPKDRTNFEPFIDSGIVALDSCVAYTGKINCYVFENKF